MHLSSGKKCVGSDDGMNQYRAKIGKYPQMNPEKEVETCIRIESGDKDAINKLVQANLRFVINVATKFHPPRWFSHADLIQDWNMWLIEAAKRFDHTRWFKFISYAVDRIKKYIRIGIMDKKQDITRQKTFYTKKLPRILKWYEVLYGQYHRYPTEGELSSYLDDRYPDVLWDLDTIRHIVWWWFFVLSMDAPSWTNDDTTLHDILWYDCEALITNWDADHVRSVIIEKLAEVLNQNEVEVVVKIYWLDGSVALSHEVIADTLWLSERRIRQIESAANLKVKSLLSKEIFYV